MFKILGLPRQFDSMISALLAQYKKDDIPTDDDLVSRLADDEANSFARSAEVNPNRSYENKCEGIRLQKESLPSSRCESSSRVFECPSL